jgi:hypothetical protein
MQQRKAKPLPGQQQRKKSSVYLGFCVGSERYAFLPVPAWLNFSKKREVLLYVLAGSAAKQYRRMSRFQK